GQLLPDEFIQHLLVFPGLEILQKDRDFFRTAFFIKKSLKKLLYSSHSRDLFQLILKRSRKSMLSLQKHYQNQEKHQVGFRQLLFQRGGGLCRVIFDRSDRHAQQPCNVLIALPFKLAERKSFLPLRR